MVAKNDITGDSIQSRSNNKAFEENVERIFGGEDKQRRLEEKKKADAEYWAKVNAETKARLEEAEKKEVKIKAAIKDVKIKGSL